MAGLCREDTCLDSALEESCLKRISMTNPNPDRMPDYAFRMMSLVMRLEDFLFPRLDRRVASFGIQAGMVVVDYGCGPGRYTTRFARLVGAEGKVYAVDVQETALEMVKDKMKAQNLKNILPVLAHGYETDIPGHCADIAFALDMFHGINDPSALLREIHRIVKADGILILDDGHQSRQRTLEKLDRSGLWVVKNATRDHLRLIPGNNASN